MYLVVLALTPATLFGVYLYGVNAALMLLVSCCAAMLSEWFLLRIRKANERSVFDGSAILTGWLLAMSLPPTTPLWVVALGSAFAIAVGKQAYGGLGQNLFNPAMLARVMLLICFPVELTNWQAISPLVFTDSGLVASPVWLGVDAITAATPLSGEIETHSVVSLAMGKHAGSFGETSSALLLLGGVFLIWQRVITAVLPSAVLLGVAIPALVLNLIDSSTFAPVHVHLFSGATLMVAFFIATDMVTSPASVKGQWLFGLGCGFLMVMIRSFGSYPEGAAFAVLIMNATTPVIDHYIKPVIFGSKAKLTQGGAA
jgi:electron transport complex protein RnfD